MRGDHGGRRVNMSTRARSKNEAECALLEIQQKIDAGDGLVWKQIPGFSRYEISDNGQVKRLPSILKQTRKPSGHLQVTVYNDHGKQWTAGTHQLVARAFLGDPLDGKPYACHIDGDPANNQPGNLYWGSAADNAADAVRHASLVRPRARSVELRRPRPWSNKNARRNNGLTGECHGRAPPW